MPRAAGSTRWTCASWLTSRECPEPRPRMDLPAGGDNDVARASPWRDRGCGQCREIRNPASAGLDVPGQAFRVRDLVPPEALAQRQQQGDDDGGGEIRRSEPGSMEQAKPPGTEPE